MSGETLAGWGSVVMLLHGLLWWGGILGCIALVTISARSARRQRLGIAADARALSPHETRVLELRRELAHAARAGGYPGPGPVRVPEEVEPGRPTAAEDRTGDLLVLAAGCSVAASGVHLAMAPLHAADGLLHVAFFVVVGVLQAVQASRLLLRPTRRALYGVLLLDLAVLATWVTSRTVGVLGTTEPVGSWDLAAAVWEVVCVVVAVRVLRGTAAGLRRPVLDPAAWSPLVLGASGLTLLTLVLLPLGGH